MNTIPFDLLHSCVPVIEKIIRTLVVYAFLVVGLRLAGKRELSQLNQFDLVVLLLLSNTVQNAIIGDDTSLVGGLVGALTLLGVNAILVRTLYHFGQLEKVEGKPDFLIRNGRPVREHLERELITIPELEAAARRQGIESLAHVKDCRIEPGGALSFVPRQPREEDRRHNDLLQHLARLEAQQRSISGRLDDLARTRPGPA